MGKVGRGGGDGSERVQDVSVKIAIRERDWWASRKGTVSWEQKEEQEQEEKRRRGGSFWVVFGGVVVVVVVEGGRWGG